MSSSVEIAAPLLRRVCVEAIEFLVVAYPAARIPNPDALASVWATVLLAVDPESLRTAVGDWVGRNDRFPTPSQIKSAALEVMRARRIDVQMRPAAASAVGVQCPMCATKYEVVQLPHMRHPRLLCECGVQNERKYEHYQAPEWAFARRAYSTPHPAAAVAEGAAV